MFSVSVISLNLRLRLITLTSTLIIPDITKTSSNNCLDTDNYKCYKRSLINNISISTVAGLNDIPLLSYWPKHLTQIYKAQYGDAMLVPIRMGTNMAAGNQRKHLALTSSIKAISLFYELVHKHIKIFSNT